MDTSQFINNNPIKSVFHPSLFETTSSDVPSDKRTLMIITKERSQRLTSDKIDNLKSPGSYDFTINDKQVSGSNTRFLFKNLYGETPLTFLFFSDKNIQNIQNMLKYLVHKQNGYIIDDQSVTELLIIMRGIFLEYSLHPKLIDESMSDQEKNELKIKYTNEVKRLNKLVIDYIVPKVVSQMQQYLDYLKDASEQPYYMDKPQNVSIQGQKQYRSTTQVLLGGNF
jgi:hypothetical protein